MAEALGLVAPVVPITELETTEFETTELETVSEAASVVGFAVTSCIGPMSVVAMNNKSVAGFNLRCAMASSSIFMGDA